MNLISKIITALIAISIPTMDGDNSTDTVMQCLAEREDLSITSPFRGLSLTKSAFTGTVP
jgi:hypothetical protein